MSALTDYTEGQFIAHVFRTGTWSKPGNLRARLFTAAPGEAGGGTEVSGGSYVPVAHAPLDANWAAPASGDGHTENSGAIAFAVPSANWGSISHTALDDGTNMLMYGALATPKTVNNGDPAPSFPVGSFDFTIA
jgi:hypothetical protein